MGKSKLNIEAIFKKYYKELCFISLHYVSNLDEAEDVVQEVFIKILSKKKFSEIENPEAYLRIAVRNTSLRYLEKNKNSVQINEELTLFESDEISDEESLQLEREAKLYHQIEKLPDACRKVFLLCAIDGYKYQEAADKLNISINTVKTQIKKAYKILREEFGSLLMVLISHNVNTYNSYSKLFLEN